MKAAQVERLNRTLKQIMWPQFSIQGNYKWLHLLPNVVQQYNSQKHRTINMKPKDVKEKDEARLLTGIKLIKIPKAKYKLGDYVRVSKNKGVFEKGYTPNWSTEIFRIKKIQVAKPRTYLLESLNDEPILGGFYEPELQPTHFKDDYLVEKVIRSKGDQSFVKWLGFDSSKNSWINKNNIL